MTKQKDVKGFIHSACCNAHWELCIKENGTYDLLCEKCNKSIGPSFLVMGTSPKDPKCSYCETETNEALIEAKAKQTLDEVIEENYVELEQLRKSGTEEEQIAKFIDDKLRQKLKEKGMLPNE